MKDTTISVMGGGGCLSRSRDKIRDARIEVERNN
jgi:hypothetical protein